VREPGSERAYDQQAPEDERRHLELARGDSHRPQRTLPRLRVEDASPIPFWLDRPRPAESPALEGTVEAGLAVVGGAFTGVWAAPARADRRGGRRGPWLRLLDRLGAGVDT
jgi:hypothetical protein